jgi:DNA-directed RNA polymerase subunit RPC12/RpoP
MFLIQCTNKGCYELQQAYIDPKTKQVFCSKCNNEILTVTQFTKNQMIANKQFKQQTKTSFMVKCNHCKKENKPILVKDEITCPHCKKIINLSAPFIQMLKEKLKTSSDI